MFFGNDWDEILKDELKAEYFREILIKLQKEYQEKIIYPPKEKVFNAFRRTSFNNLKVVIVGQDPYHGEKQAEGLSFSVQKGVSKPPSLRNIFKELKADLNIDEASHGSLLSWADEGVLLLNAVLSVEKDKAASHKHLNWEAFTDKVIQIISDKKDNIVFILWGNFAKNKSYLIDESKHLIISSAHPSPFSAHNGFFASKPFSRTNDYLRKNNLPEINWKIKE